MADKLSFDSLDPNSGILTDVLDPNSGILTDVLRTFNGSLNDAAGNVVSGGAKLAAAFMFLQWVKLVLEVGISRRLAPHALVHLVGALVWWSLCKNAAGISDWYMKLMGGLGSSFAGTAALGGGSIMNDPSLIIDLALRVFIDLIKKVNDLSIWVSAGTMAGAVLVAFGMFAGLAVIGFLAIYAVVKAKLQVILGLVLLPFSIEPRTSFLASRGIGMIVDAGVGLGATSLVVGFSYGFINRIQPSASGGDLRYAINLLIAGALFAVLTGGTMALMKGGALALKAMRMMGA